MIRVIAAALHLLALGLGLGAVLTRGNSLREPITAQSLKRTFRADTVWGIAAALWLSTGLWRLFGELEKTTSYYVANHFFRIKMTLFVVIILLELSPIITLVRWRAAVAQGEAQGEDQGNGASPYTFVTPGAAKRLAMISHIEALLVVLMIFAAAAMARGYGIPHE